mmetsp:Transcript_19235/g.50044  ORF Transcript_19235/g.50044 Transcript_19235/m.50044 type:complete len:242 (+) Transcript_19235:422-1147(+)
MRGIARGGASRVIRGTVGEEEADQAARDRRAPVHPRLEGRPFIIIHLPAPSRGRGGGRLRRRDDGQHLVRGVALVQQLVGVRYDGIRRARQHERRRQPQRRALAPQVVETHLPRRVRLPSLAVQVQVSVCSGHGPRAVEGARSRRGGPSADAADGDVGAYWRRDGRRIGGVVFVVEVHGPDALVVAAVGHDEAICWGGWGECGHAALPCRERSATGSVWVRVVSVFASCASGVAQLDVRPP